MADIIDKSWQAAVAALCLAALLTPPASARPQAPAPKPRAEAPLRFDPPAAGPAQRANPGYDACIDQPSPDGAAIDCQALLRPASAAKPRRNR